MTAVAFDATSTASLTGDGITTTLSWSHTCTGSRLVLVVGVAGRRDAAGEIVAVTYNDVPLTRAGAQTFSTNTHQASLWYLVAPATGAHPILITWTAAPLVGHRLIGCAASYTGASPVRPIAGVTTTTGSSATPAASLDAPNAASRVVDVLDMVASSGSVLTVGGDQTARQNVTNGTVGGTHGALGDRAGGVAGASVSWSSNLALSWGMVAAVIYAVDWPNLYETHIQQTRLVQNAHRDVAYPTWEITGPGEYLILRNDTTGAVFTLTGEILRTELITIDMDPTQRTVRGSIQGELRTRLLAGSEFWALAPGPNQIFVELGQTLPESTVVLRLPSR